MTSAFQRAFRLFVVLSLSAFGLAPPALAKDGPGCAALISACSASGKSGSAIESQCVMPLLAGETVAGLGPVSQRDIAACNVERSHGKIPPTPPARLQGAKAPGPDPEKALDWPAGAPKRPNVVFILADDLDMKLISQREGILEKTMPNLAQMIRDGAEFTHYFVTDSLCCPSRSSIFTGLVPHNSGVFTNDPPDGGYAAFMAHGDEKKTFAVLLHAAHYATGMMGKYLNHYQPRSTDGVPPGWSEWAVAGNGYPNFNYVLNHNGTLIVPAPHLTDEMSILGRKFIGDNKDRPFLLELATFSPHVPYIPPVRYDRAFMGLKYPRDPAYGARPDATAPAWLRELPPLTMREKNGMQYYFRRRMESDKGIDDMIGAVRSELDRLGIADNTYVIFSSDNGYHMGEYSLRRGKLTPFDTDIRVPLVIVGPHVPPGSKVNALAENIDLSATFAEIAGLPPPNVDGKSLLPLAEGKDPGPWRQAVLIEHHHLHTVAPTNPDRQTALQGDPPDYEALRFYDSLYVEYATGEVGYYDLATDPYELKNIAGTLPPARRAALHAALMANEACRGSGACWQAARAAP